MRTSPWIFAAVTAAAPSHIRRQEDSSSSSTNTSSSIGVAESFWDGQCYYPKATEHFDLNMYLGRWYQVAGSAFGETAGCKCIFAEYTQNENGTVNVLNGCQAADQDVRIQGIAREADKAYGDAGVLRVQFPPQPPPECPGPNYIVQAYEPRWAIVQASNFSTLFLLSRDQNPADELINEWLDRAQDLGTNLTDVSKIDQTGCLYTG